MKWKGLLVLGCEPEAFICFNDPDQTTGTLASNDRVEGTPARHGRDPAGGAPLPPRAGDPVGRRRRRLLLGLPAGAVGPPAYTDYEDNVINGDATVVGLRTCWSGFIRNRVGGSVTYSDNKLADPDANEVVTNVIKHNLVCTTNSPKVQIGDSGGLPNKVGGKALGQCAALV